MELDYFKDKNGGRIDDKTGKIVKNGSLDGGNVVSDVVSLSQVYLTDRQQRICKLIEDNPTVSSKQMSQVLSVDPRTVQRDLAVMQKKGVLIREGNTSAGRWVFNKQPPKTTTSSKD